MKLLKQMCEIHAPAGEELAMTNFLLNYIEENSNAHYSAIFQCE